jgi:hypothetical protein
MRGVNGVGSAVGAEIAPKRLVGSLPLLLFPVTVTAMAGKPFNATSASARISSTWMPSLSLLVWVKVYKALTLKVIVILTALALMSPPLALLTASAYLAAKNCDSSTSAKVATKPTTVISPWITTVETDAGLNVGVTVGLGGGSGGGDGGGGGWDLDGMLVGFNVGTSAGVRACPSL